MFRNRLLKRSFKFIHSPLTSDVAFEFVTTDEGNFVVDDSKIIEVVLPI